METPDLAAAAVGTIPVALLVAALWLLSPAAQR